MNKKPILNIKSQVKSKRMETDDKKAEVSVLISDKAAFRKRSIIRDKETFLNDKGVNLTRKTCHAKKQHIYI